MVGLSDGGAHVDMLCDAGYCTYLLGTWVRERQAMPLEYAIKRITSEPADFFGISNRGRLLPGMAADIVAFDYNTVGSDKRGQMRNDLPGGGRRLATPGQSGPLPALPIPLRQNRARLLVHSPDLHVPERIPV